MGRILALGPQAGTLGHAEAVLFVDDGQPQARELHRLLDHRMGSDEYLHVARGQSVQHGLAPLAFHDAREQLHADGEALQKRLDGGEVLLGEYLRRGHHAGLEAVVDGDEHAHEGHQRLARAHVALQKAVHLPAAVHVRPDFVHHPLLRPGQFERQVVGVEVVESLAHVRKAVAPVLAAVVARVP